MMMMMTATAAATVSTYASNSDLLLQQPQQPQQEQLQQTELPIDVVVRTDNPSNDGDDDDDASSLSSLSSGSSDEEQPATPTSRSPENPRSLFSNYWTKQGESPAPRKRLQPRSPSPSCVMRMNRSVPQDVDPYEHFGLYEDEVQEQETDEEEYSTNTYERMINYCDVPQQKPSRSTRRRRPYESQPLWATWFSASTPSLSKHSSTRGNLLSSMANGFRSEPVLHSKPLASVLRKGRFSKSAATAPANPRHVRFQPKITVQSYEPPVENWAADGWSSWFGV